MRTAGGSMTAWSIPEAAQQAVRLVGAFPESRRDGPMG